jgi:hypothetical protein
MYFKKFYSSFDLLMLFFLTSSSQTLRSDPTRQLQDTLQCTLWISEDNLRHLDMLSHVAILVTMLGRDPFCDEALKWYSKDIQPTNEAACLRIYHDIYPDPKMIVISVDCCTYWDTCLLPSHSWRDWRRKGG